MMDMLIRSEKGSMNDVIGSEGEDDVIRSLRG